MRTKRAFPELDLGFLGQRIEESLAGISDALTYTDKPLVIQFSGGKDSMVMLDLTRSVTDNYVCSYMKSGIDLPGSVEFAISSARSLGKELLISEPKEHKGDFYERLAQFRKFPTVRGMWCQRDLKVRPQQKMLNRMFGRGNFMKLIGVRRSESARRMIIYKRGVFVRPDNQVGGAYNYYPILHWTDDDIINYLEMKGLPISGLYKKYSVSGCYWCPFYQPSIYEKILVGEPGLLDRVIDWEKELGPSVGNYIYLGDIKDRLSQYKLGESVNQGGE